MKSITANIGEKIEVKDNNGDVMGYFYFNPADPDIIRRCNVVQDKLNELTNSISDKGDRKSKSGNKNTNAVSFGRKCR